jgi:hypothetical protein
MALQTRNVFHAFFPFQTALNSCDTQRTLKEQLFDTSIFRHKKTDLVNAKVVHARTHARGRTHTHTQNGLIVAAGVRKKMPVRKLHSYDHCTGHGVTKVII